MSTEPEMLSPPEVHGARPDGPAGPGVLQLVAGVTLLVDVSDSDAGPVALAVRREELDGDAERLLGETPDAERFRPVGPVAARAALLDVDEPLLPAWFATLAWLAAWVQVRDGLRGLIAPHWIARRTLHDAIADVEQATEPVPGPALACARALAGRIRLTQRFDADPVDDLLEALRATPAGAAPDPGEDEEPVEAFRSGVAAGWGRRAVLLELAGLHDGAASRWRSCAAAWRTAFNETRAEAAERRAASAGGGRVVQVVPQDPGSERPAGDRLQLVADAGTRLDVHADRPLFLDVVVAGAAEPVASLRADLHAGWLRLRRLTGKALVWVPTGESIGDIHVQEDRPATLDELAQLLRVTGG